MGFIVFIAIIAGIVFYVSNSAAKANRQKWQSAANQLKLAFTAGGGSSVGRIAGSINGHTVTIGTFTRGSGNSSQTYTKYTLEYRDRIPVDFKMVTQGLRHSVGKAFGLQDIEVGDKAFDDQILLQGARPEAVVEWLSPGLRNDIRVLAATYPDIVITNDLVVVNKRGTDTEPGIIAHIVRRLVNFCDVITSASSVDSDFHMAPDTEPQNLEDNTYEPVFEPVEPAFNPLTSSNPIVPEPVWTELEVDEPFPDEKDPAAEVETVVIEEVPPAVEAVQLEEHDAPVLAEVVELESIATELSGGDSGQSLIAGKIFEQKYKGRQIKGSGVLRRVSRFSYDPIFKNCRGVKAIIELCELAGPYSAIKVSAVVKYSEEDHDALEAKVDEAVPISGTLVAFDSMMHHYFIEP